jgi:metal-responsive CopG/Arc/MetJ family transcriptional regulator
MRIITVKLDEELLLQLDLFVVNNGGNRSRVIRDAIKSYLDQKAR